MATWVAGVRNLLHALSDASTLAPAAIDLGLKDLLKSINRAMFGAVFELIELLFSEALGEMLKLQPSELSKVAEMYELSTILFFSLLTLFGLSYLGMFQLFPGNEDVDPYQFMTRAFAALMAILIVNPPGDGTLFAQGAFAWAFEVTNASIDLFLQGANFGQSLPSNPSIGGDPSLQTTIMLMLYGSLILLVVGLTQILLFIVLVARQIIIILTYGLFPLLLVFWIADAGPLKYAKQLSEKLFKATGMLIPAGILFAAIFRVGTTFLAETLTGSAAMTADGSFATPMSFVIDLTQPTAILAATCALPILICGQGLSGTGLGGAASAATSAGKKLGSKAKGMAGLGGSGDGGGDSLASSETVNASDQQSATSGGGTTASGDSSSTSSVKTDAAPELENPSTRQIVADGGADFTSTGGGEYFEQPDGEYTEVDAKREAMRELDDSYVSANDTTILKDTDELSAEERQQYEDRAEYLHYRKGTDVDLGEMSGYEFRQKDEAVQQEIVARAFENGDMEALSEGIDEIGDTGLLDHAKAGVKKGGIKSIAKGAVAGGAIALGAGAGGLPAIAAAAAVGAGKGFAGGAAAGSLKSMAGDHFDKDIQSWEGIKDKGVTGTAETIADDLGDLVDHSPDDDDTARTTKETDADVGTGENEYFNGDAKSGNDLEE
ncbi:hypothetical protein [Halorubellus sp. PRR65]|uniref:hypothetical protein n=1 Tax=Halorubellus sp. PRR65 TaxID=3098148 RepID=UPI002B25D452|nr:hypothetical protein [Halorubellus sp. PRR65]